MGENGTCRRGIVVGSASSSSCAIADCGGGGESLLWTDAPAAVLHIAQLHAREDLFAALAHDIPYSSSYLVKDCNYLPLSCTCKAKGFIIS